MRSVVTRSEYIKWAQARALGWLPHEPQQAVMSLVVDLRQREDTVSEIQGHKFDLAMEAMRHERQARAYIEGFPE